MNPETLCCLGCGLSFSLVTPHPVDTLPGFGIVAYCEGCHSLLSLGEKKSLATQLINQWREGLLERDYDAIEDAAHTVIEMEHLLIVGK
jgi:hypothetical protein